MGFIVTPLSFPGYPSTMRRVTVATFGSRTEADIAVARLAADGIEAMILTDSAGGFEPQLEAVRGVRVMVWEEDLVDAHDSLGLEGEATPAAEPTPAPLWLRAMSAVGLIVVVLGLVRLIFLALG